MDPYEVVILCGEWEMGTGPQRLSKEEFNVVLKVKDIKRHPNFNPKHGVEGGNDLAIFKIDEDEVEGKKDINRIYPICLPEPGRLQATEGVNSGWSLPPPAYFLKKFGNSLLPTITNINKSSLLLTERQQGTRF